MNPQSITDTWFPILINGCVQSTLVLGVAAFLLLLLRSRSAATRHLIACLGLGTVLVVPVLTLLRPPSIIDAHAISHFVSRPARAARAGSSGGSVKASAVAPAAPANPTAAVEVTHPQNAAAAKSASPGRAATIDDSASDRAVPSSDARRPLASAKVGPTLAAALGVPALAAWALGSALVLLWFLYGYVRLAIVAGRFPELADERLKSEVLELARDAGHRGGLKVVSDTPLTPVAVPITWGVRTPVILLPHDATKWPQARLRAVILHETAHIVRRDWAVLAIARVACALAWFNPLAWYLLAVARAEAERASDDAALAAGMAPAEYAGHLLDTVRAVQRLRLPVAAISMARNSLVTARVISILKPGQPRGILNRRSLLGMLAATALALTVVAGVHPLAAQTRTSEQPGTSAGFIDQRPDIQDILVKACVMQIAGPGVEVTLSDARNASAAGSDPSQRLIHDQDIADVVNTLKVAGAEALSVGEERLTARSVIHAVGRDITVNGIRLQPPYVVRAIGKTDALVAALTASGGPAERIRRGDPTMLSITSKDSTVVPGGNSPERRWSRSTVPVTETNPELAQILYLRSHAGLTERTGPGIVVTLRDSERANPGAPANAAIRDRDLLAVIDQLRMAGAEEMAMGDQRVVATTGVHAAGAGMLVNGAPVSAPFVVKAIGDPGALLAAANGANGAIDRIRRVDPNMVRAERTDSLSLPAYRGAPLRYARTAVMPAFQQPQGGGLSGQSVTLSDGTVVELIGVGSAPYGDGEDWWRPDGTPLLQAPVQTNNRFHNSYTGVGTQYLSRSLFFRLHGRIDGQVSTTGIVEDPTHHLDKDGYHHGRDTRLNDTRLAPGLPAAGAVLLAFPKSEKRCTYQFGIATGPWETIAVTKIVPEYAAAAVSAANISRESSASISLDASPTIFYTGPSGTARSQVLLDAHPPLGDVARRVVALDSAGKQVDLDPAGVSYVGDEMISVRGRTLARIAEIRLETRPYLWAEFRDIALQPRSTPGPAPIATPAPLPAFRHTFACGLTISMNEVTERKSDGGRWWLPDGRRLPAPLREYMNKLAFTGWPEAWHPKAILTRHSARKNVKYSEAWQTSTEEEGVRHNYYEAEIRPADVFSNMINVGRTGDKRDCTVRVGIAAGPWQSGGRIKIPTDVKRKETTGKTFEGDISLVLSNHPSLDYTNTAGQKVRIPFLANNGSIGNAARMIVGIDRNGHEVPLQVTGGGGSRVFNGEREPTDFIELSYADSGNLHNYNQFNLENIKEFRLKTRPYEWAEFRGIRLNPEP